jgi:hypothetical protein
MHELSKLPQLASSLRRAQASSISAAATYACHGLCIKLLNMLRSARRFREKAADGG